MPLLLLLASAPALAEQICDTRAYPLSAPTERFEDHGDGTVSDRETQLMWVRCSVGQEWSDGACVGSPSRHDWGDLQAVADEANLTEAYGFDDWRLPNLPELATIAERQCQDPRINLTVFPTTPADLYWSASIRPATDAAGRAYALSFGAEGVVGAPQSEQHYVRLVRSAE